MPDIPTRVASRRMLITSAVLGNFVEWYDFFLYATAASLVIGPAFFPVRLSPALATAASFSTFSVGFLARPLGGVLFGHIGDRHGRRAAMVLTIGLMGMATVMIGCLPTYRNIGPLAPALLIGLRLVQGCAAGGEWSGGVLMLSEAASARHRGFLSSWSQVGVGLGLAGASASFLVVSSLSSLDPAGFGWRIPFLGSIIVVAACLIVRLRLQEDPVPASVAQMPPALVALRRFPVQIGLAIALRSAENGGIYILTGFTLYYGRVLHLPGDLILSAVTVGMVVECVAMPVFGAISDRIGRARVYAFGAVALACLSIPLFEAIQSGRPNLIRLAFVIALPIAHGAMIGAQPALFSDLFPRFVRYSGVAIGHEVGSALAGGLSPLLAIGLLDFVGINGVISFLWLLAAVTLSGLIVIRDRIAFAPGDPFPSNDQA